MANNLRFQVVEEAFKKHALDVKAPSERPSEYFGKYVFNRQKMYKYLPKDIYDKMIDVMDNGARLDRSIADAVAAGMKQWALEMGVTHYTHWFQPLTEGTAEKHDAFVEHDGKGGMIEKFSGKLLVQQEPDASSFPNGGIRNTFEARGYSAWDPTSPVFIIDDTLCIPTIFIAYTGEALDYKAPLLRAIHAVNKAAKDVCQYFYDDVTKVQVNLGWEQEYFLVDEGLYSARPDLLMTGRTLMGHESAKNQQMDDHYFGTIPDRVQAFMKDLEIQSLELAIPVKTRHNEVAPNQFELAPIFEECNLAVDHNMLLMSLMKKVARKHGFRVLLHEKPFDGINGSGKHCNWSLSADNGVLLHAPGTTPEENLRFITFIVETLMAVYHHNGLLKASIMSATNAHRLGGNEAPPAIISSFLGTQLTEVLNHIETSETNELFNLKGKQGMEIDIPQIPDLVVDNTDRNRTSPFAFTGNRFEFRAPGSSVNCASAMIALNAAMAEALNSFKERVDAKIAKGEDKIQALLEVLKDDVKTCKPIRFDGNGYSEEWVKEAAKRGLDVEKSCPVIFEHYLDESSIKMFESTKVMNKKELEARNEVKWEMYVKTVQIEARVLGDLAMNHIIPVATHYQSKLIKNVQGMKEVFPAERAERLSTRNMKLIEEIAERTERIEQLVEELTDARRVANRIEDIHERAIQYHDTVCPHMEAIRKEIDKLELIVEDGLWTLPKYRELLFIR
ncbi:glutamine synthetase [Prevotella communis]|uniref:Glutamine synthetase n=1 Tax=Prevotella communis TaxID=2913614 RepID=A0A1G8B0A2_9BACT|nr:glutamine synthetase III [Prevotella communis]UKK58674.1 glutamine synthetase III [Prevotella communis]UKK66614.1 glutamine synthetase III [Prevotella communis]UKK71246.1 glutamine synthetase III [Prevotella communis]SDH26561.1 glutamine synthetase [Prevotella communis]